MRGNWGHCEGIKIGRLHASLKGFVKPLYSEGNRSHPGPLRLCPRRARDRERRHGAISLRLSIRKGPLAAHISASSRLPI
jgi:hypothetical protein